MTTKWKLQQSFDDCITKIKANYQFIEDNKDLNKDQISDIKRDTRFLVKIAHEFGKQLTEIKYK